MEGYAREFPFVMGNLAIDYGGALVLQQSLEHAEAEVPDCRDGDS